MDEDLVDKGDHTRHETDSHGSHTVEDEVEDSSEKDKGRSFWDFMFGVFGI